MRPSRSRSTFARTGFLSTLPSDLIYELEAFRNLCDFPVTIRKGFFNERIIELEFPYNTIAITVDPRMVRYGTQTGRDAITTFIDDSRGGHTSGVLRLSISDQLKLTTRPGIVRLQMGSVDLPLCNELIDALYQAVE